MNEETRQELIRRLKIKRMTTSQGREPSGASPRANINVGLDLAVEVVEKFEIK